MPLTVPTSMDGSRTCNPVIALVPRLARASGWRAYRSVGRIPGLTEDEGKQLIVSIPAVRFFAFISLFVKRFVKQFADEDLPDFKSRWSTLSPASKRIFFDKVREAVCYPT